MAFLAMVFVGIFYSCVTADYKMLSPQELAEFEVIGPVATKFISMQPFHILSGKAISAKAYSQLLAESRKKYQGNIDVVDINVNSTWNALTLAIPIPMVSWIFWNFQTVIATGYVILRSGGNVNASAAGVEGALEKASVEIAENFTARARLAIVYITAQDRSQTDFIAGELEHLLRKQGFVIIDRSELERVRREQNFSISGEVDDTTAVSIGKFAGANIIITGRVDGEGNLRRLRLRALDTTSAQVVGTASERL